jgi:phytoene synthase
MTNAATPLKPDARTAAAYHFCRDVARREAKNFYWSFRVLPRHKSDAMCAVYAFMRRADDLSDDESKSLDARRTEMSAWLEAWRASRATALMNSTPAASDDPVFRALAHTQRTFNIPDNLLEQLVAGTTMDLEPHAAATNSNETPGTTDSLQTYATFDDLYRYCYLVASVVGLVCIKIFGYSDPAAEHLAEETGIALQLTNILRDVKEDIERDRLYIPLDLLDEFGESVEDIRALATGRRMSETERAMLATLAIRAEKYYLSANKLLPLIDRDSRAALWVLVTIYHRLLNRIAEQKMEVFRQRVALSTGEKLSVLLRGACLAAVNRVTK